MNHDPQTLSYQMCSATTGLAMAAAPKPSKGREGEKMSPLQGTVWLDSKVQPQLLAQEGLSSCTFPSSLQKHSGFPSQTQLLLRLESAQMQDLGPSAFLSVYEAVKRYLSHF